MDKTDFQLPDIPITPKKIGMSIVIALVLYIGYSSYYTVSAESVGIVQRFGEYQYAVDPGLHFKIPFGVDSVIEVPIKRQLKEEFGFGTPGATIVTGDLNTALVEWVIQFRIVNAFDFLFKVRDPGAALRDISESVMREVVGDRTVDEVLTIGRQDIEASAQIKMQAVTSLYEMGLRIDQVQLKNVNPPKLVQASFDEVNEAKQERERVINVARGEYNKAIPRAKGRASQKVQSSEGYAIQRVNEAEGDSNKFNALLKEYIKAPAVTKRRLYLETMAEVLPKVTNKVVLDDKAASILPLLQLNKIKGDVK